MKQIVDAFRRIVRGRRRRVRIAVVAPEIVLADGVGNAVRDTVRAVSAFPDFDVSVFARVSEAPELTAHRTETARDLAKNRIFAASDIVIYHFGYYDPLFEIIPKWKGRARQIVFFHNITPAQFVPAGMKLGIKKSFEQLRYFAEVDRVWPFTSTSAQVLFDAGMDPRKVRIVEPVVEWPPPFRLAKKLAEKREGPVEILFVGRMVESKGVLDLLQAFEKLRAQNPPAFRLRIVGKRSDETYFKRVLERVAALAPDVQFLGQIASEHLAQRYRAAHILAIPSYHEGFCRPVAEGLRAGCLPVGYSSYHLPLVANGLGRLVSAGNIAALAEALQAVAESLSSLSSLPTVSTRVSLPLDRGPTSPAEFDHLTQAHVDQFTFERLSKSVVSGILELAR